jgi:ATP-dependent helicase/nuclease subunit A
MSTPTRRTPNPEQDKAIYHSGGKLLSAGAGSGKTFVLIEHLVSLLSQIPKNHRSNEWNKEIVSKLSKIVLMTFTKKAAGEMSVRMMRRVEEKICEEAENEDNLHFWSLVNTNLAYLNITTIHGFCHRLLSLGYWSEFPQQINLVSSIEHKDKIQRLFDKWFTHNQETLNPIFLASANAFVSAMVEIFSSPELRVLWSNPLIPTNPNEEIDQFFLQLLQAKSYNALFEESIDLLTDSKSERTKWFELLKAFSELSTSLGALNSRNYEVYNNFLKSITSFPRTTKDISQGQKDSLLYIKELRADLKDFNDDLNAITEEFTTYKKWVETISDLFQFIDAHYFEIEGFSFADLEYYVLKALGNEKVLEKVQENFGYFIVDEFQDTSFIQFEILKKLIGTDTSKLFCVGDRKQAIYGFRGGELQVFSECTTLLGSENNYFLKNNFRSFSSIIDYNNLLFERVFPLGLTYEGRDPHSVQMETQVIPPSNLNAGKVLELNAEVVGTSAETDLDQLEANVLCEHVKELLTRTDLHSICILYRKLKPSSLLLELFVLNEISFNAQIKIQFAQDPLINIFLYLVELKLNENHEKKKQSTLFLLKTLFSVINVQTFHEKFITQFFLDEKLYGVMLAFNKFMFSMGLTNSFHFQNSNILGAICKLAKEDLVKIYHLLKNDEGEEYSCEMMSGDAGNGKKRIILMSAHASKGLEFDAVLLAGIHTNGRYGGMRSQVGKFPHSFKWKNSLTQKRFNKSPFYHLEAEILKLKDFSESKRLLYVACTRAVKHLGFTNLWGTVKNEVKNFYTNENSWIQALRLIPTDKVEMTVQRDSRTNEDISLMQQDSLGLMTMNSSMSLGMISELSVTRLATIADCSFKFYLQNICKIDLDKTSSSFISEEEESEKIFHSSKKRGTEIHSYLSKIFLTEISKDKLPTKESEKILWAYDCAEAYINSHEVISEKLIKFSMFGQMISGTPDIVFVHSEELVVWDFKTGARDKLNEASYWFQLTSYAYAYGMLKRFAPDKKIELALLYLDEKQLVKKIFSMDEITQAMFKTWKKTEFLDQVNPLHCPHCEYSTICQNGKSFA